MVPAVIASPGAALMNPAARKKVVLRLLAHGALASAERWLAGVVDPAVLADTQAWEILLPQGQLVRLDPAQVQAVYFVSNLDAAAALALPPARGAVRLPGVQVRCRTRDRQVLDGILASDLLRLEVGVELTPLFSGCPWQRVHVPRPALLHLSVVEVLRPAHRRRSMPAPELQFGLFDPASSLNLPGGPANAPR
ncbi:MAG: DUF6982 domain-containing protein [Terriglobales bacterium]